MKQETFDDLFEKSVFLKKIKAAFHEIEIKHHDSFFELHEMMVSNDHDVNYEVENLNNQIEQLKKEFEEFKIRLRETLQ